MPISTDRFHLFESSKITLGAAGATVDVVETQVDGAGTFTLTVNAPHASLFLEGPKICWLQNGKCCDGAILVECEDGVHLHLIELKKTVNASKWIKIKTQWCAMYHNVLGIAAIARKELRSVTCHVAFSNDNFAASPTLGKVVVSASGISKSQNHEWYEGALQLDDLFVPFIKHQRDQLGNAISSIDC